MKGVVFTELLDMASGTFGDELVEEVIDMSDLPSGGAYTAVGTYDYHEIVTLSVNLSAKTNVPLPEFLKAFGRHLFGRFAALYPMLFDGVNDSFKFLELVDDYIHVEVRKLYPDAELPQLECVRHSDGTMDLTYLSCRPFGDFCHGLIDGCIAHFGDDVSCAREDKPAGNDNAITFHLKRAT